MMPRWELLCIDSPSPNVSVMPPSSAERRSPPHRWWSDSTTCTASAAIAGGEVLEGDHAHVGRERHVGARRRPTPCRRCRASGPRGTPRRPPVARRPRRRSRASRRRWGPGAAAGPGNAARSASIAAHSSSGGNTPPLSLSEPKPQPSTIRCAWATIPSGSSASPHSSSGSWPGWPPTCRRGSR